jgi:hypothetical protein
MSSSSPSTSLQELDKICWVCEDLVSSANSLHKRYANSFLLFCIDCVSSSIESTEEEPEGKIDWEHLKGKKDKVRKIAMGRVKGKKRPLEVD